MTDSEFIKICNDSISMSDAQRCIGIPYTSFARKAKRLGCYKVSNQIWNKGLTIDYGKYNRGENHANYNGSESNYAN